MKRFLLIILTLMMLLSVSACADTTVNGSVVRTSADGNAELDIIPQKLMEKVDIGETAVVTIGDFRAEMPFVEELIEEDGKMQLLLDREDWGIYICIYNQDFCQTYDIATGDRVRIMGE